jgi:hypothetical protein
MDRKPLDTVTLSKTDLTKLMSQMEQMMSTVQALERASVAKVDPIASSHLNATEVPWATKPSGEIADDINE